MASETKDAHVVEIPVDEEHLEKLSSSTTNATLAAAIQHHPLMEISRSPGHLLLLKLWQREEALFGRRAALKEAQLDSARREIFQLCFSFFVFHGFFLTLLYTSSVNSADDHHHHSACKKWWLPAILSLCTSLVFVGLVQVKLYRYWKVSRQLQRERSDNRALGRCVQELRMKGASFDLSKEPTIGKRMKSSSVEIKWRPLTWCSQNVVTVCLLCFADFRRDPERMSEPETGGGHNLSAGISVKLFSCHLLFLDLSGDEATGSDAARDDAKSATPAQSNAYLCAYDSYNAS